MSDEEPSAVTGDLDDLLPLFLEEAGVRLDRVSALLDGAASDPGATVQVRRELHALKGAARMMGLHEVAELCHRAEDQLVGESAGGLHGAREIADLLMEVLDDLRDDDTAPISSDQTAAPPVSRRKRWEIRGGSGELRVATGIVDGLAERSARMRVSAKASGALVRGLFEIAADAERVSREGAHGPAVADLAATLRRTALDLERATNVLQRLGDEQLDVLLRVQVQPLRPFLRTLARHTRELARSLGKEVKVTTGGGEVQLDRRILEAIREASLHLVRNAVDHGVENASTRIAAGKEAQGRIRLEAVTDGDRVRLTVADDGRGIDPARVVEVAAERGLVNPSDAARLTQHETYQLLYLPGFTTRDLATDVSGRGVGLDAVAAAVRAVGGDIWIRSDLGAGTRVTIELPVTRRGERVLVVEVGALHLAVPSAAVRSFCRFRPEAVTSEDGRALIRNGDQTMGVVFLGRLFGQSPARNAILVEVNIGGSAIGLVVDAIVGDEEVFVRPMPAVAGAPAAVEGAALMAHGQPVAVLALQRLGPLELALTSVPDGAAGRPSARVLLVEDVTATREMLRRLLEDGGLAVIAVRSVDEALAELERMTVDCVVTDIEMPGSSGIDLTRHLRSSDRFAGLPIIAVSMHDRPANRLAGLEAGADAYLGKSAADLDDLVAAVRRLTARPA